MTRNIIQTDLPGAQVDIPLVKFSSISGSNDATSTRRSSVNFGTLGLCNLNVPQTTPTRTLADPRLLGTILFWKKMTLNARPLAAGEISAIGLPAFSNSKGKTLNNLLNALILHQVAAGVAFIAFLLAVISHRIGFLLASAVASLAWVITLVAMAIDFALFGVIKTHVHDAHNGMTASYGVATWTTLAAFIILFFATNTTCFACVTGRRGKKTRVGNRRY
ncbi:hypothetical protein FRB98_002371 [Tulasnella sp. 332]|nr:hypothetical protein FRB98_002371 [Tulasnella sp. 332]